ncbi:hypothetical protein ON010_g3715 [Phytophthora cinnamomi]|nr:hypothetical protein ON010_g3715 [Phytophthora cinnamomi]
MPESKVLKARTRIVHALQAKSLTRTEYRSLLGSLRHVATCIHPAKVFLQRLRRAEFGLNRVHRVLVSNAMVDDLVWWLYIRDSGRLNGVPLQYFGDVPRADVDVFVDASNYGLCAADVSREKYLTYTFSIQERQLISDFQAGETNGFDINFVNCYRLPLPFMLGDRSGVAHPRSYQPINVQRDLAQCLRENSVAPPTHAKYRKAFHQWWELCAAVNVDPYGIAADRNAFVDLITRSFLTSYQRGLRSSSISGLLHGIQHFLNAVGSPSVFGHPQIRMLLKGIRRLDTPPAQKASVTLELLDSCLRALDPTAAGDRMLWGILCMAFFFLLRRSDIAARGKTFRWFTLRDEDVAVLDDSGQPTYKPEAAKFVAIRLRGSKTSQHGPPTDRVLSRSGHPFICPVFGSLCLKHFRGPARTQSSIAEFISQDLRQHAVSLKQTSEKYY